MFTYLPLPPLLLFIYFRNPITNQTEFPLAKTYSERTILFPPGAIKTYIFTMSQENDFLVRLPDYPNVLQTRIENRPLHLTHNKPHFESGKIAFGGPMYSSQPESLEDGMSKITGSIHVCKAATEEEVWEMVRNDPYAKLGVWDLAKTVVTPMKVFVSKPL